LLRDAHVHSIAKPLFLFLVYITDIADSHDAQYDSMPSNRRDAGAVSRALVRRISKE
jgi:hypothetical protein